MANSRLRSQAMIIGFDFLTDIDTTNQLTCLENKFHFFSKFQFWIFQKFSKCVI